MIIGLAILWPSRDRDHRSALLLVFTNLRQLTLDQIRNGWNGLFHLMRNLGLVRLARPGEQLRRSGSLDYWWISIPLTLFLLAVVRDLARARPVDARAAPCAQRVRRRGRRRSDVTDAVRATMPVRRRTRCPRRCAACSYRYPNATTDALADVTLDVRARGARRDRRRERFGEVDARRGCSRAAARPTGGRARTARRGRARPHRAGPRSSPNGPRRRCSACACATTSCGACRIRSASTSTRILDRVGLARLRRPGDVDAVGRRAAAPRDRGRARARAASC